MTSGRLAHAYRRGIFHSEKKRDFEAGGSKEPHRKFYHELYTSAGDFLFEL